MTSQEKVAVQTVALAILQTIAETDDGAPSTALYLGSGLQLNQYNQIMSQMEAKRFIENDYDFYTITVTGKIFMSKLAGKLDTVH